MNKEKRFRKSRLWWIGGAIVLALVLLVALRVREISHIPPQEVSPWALRTAPVKVDAVTRGFPVLATVTTEGEITISGQIAGTITDMGPREGTSVTKGDFLARIDTRELEQSIASLQAKLEAAGAEVTRQESELGREEKLFQEGGSSETSLDARRTAAVAARQNVLALQRQIAGLQVRKSYGRVKAPADGVISARLREPGDVCMPGHPLYRMTVSEGARVQVKLPQSVLEEIEPGADLVLTHGSNRQVVQLDRVYPSVDKLDLGTSETDLPLPPFGLASGSRIPGRVIIERRSNALVLPPDALVTGEDPGRGRVFKVSADNGTVQVVRVLVLLVGRNGVAVEGDLAENDRVVVAHESVLLKLRDGDSVTVNQGGM